MISKAKIQEYQNKNEKFERGINKETEEHIKRFKLSLIEELEKDNPSEARISDIFDSLNADVQGVLLKNSDELRKNIIDFFSIQLESLGLSNLVENVTYQSYGFVDSLINQVWKSRLNSLDVQKIVFVSAYRTFKFKNLDKLEIERNLMKGDENSFISPYQKILNSLTLEITDKLYKTINGSLTEGYLRTNQIFEGGQNG